MSGYKRIEGFTLLFVTEPLDQQVFFLQYLSFSMHCALVSLLIIRLFITALHITNMSNVYICFYSIDRETAAKIDPKLQKGLFVFAVSNSCMNPIVYGKTVNLLVSSLTIYSLYTAFL